MTSDLDKLKVILRTDPAAKGYYDAALVARVIEGKVHAAAHCRVGSQAELLTLTLSEVLKLDYSHGCMKRADFKLDCPPKETASSLVKLLNLMEQIPHYDVFTMNTPSHSSIKAFLKLFKSNFSTIFNTTNAAAPEATLNWLNIRRGYPANAHAIMDIFAQQATKSCWGYIPQSENYLSSREVDGPKILFMEPADFTIYRGLRTHPLISVMVYLAIKEYQVPGTSLVVVPKSFRSLFRFNISIWDSQKIKINRAPSAEALLTVETLIGSGMSLEKAWKAATAL